MTANNNVMEHGLTSAGAGGGDALEAIKSLASLEGLQDKIAALETATEANQESLKALGLGEDIVRLHKEAETARTESADVLTQARAEAKQIVADAQAEADKIKEEASAAEARVKSQAEEIEQHLERRTADLHASQENHKDLVDKFWTDANVAKAEIAESRKGVDAALARAKDAEEKADAKSAEATALIERVRTAIDGS